MAAQTSEPSEPTFGTRTLGFAVLVAIAALIVRVATRPLGDGWSLALFGAVLLGGQNAVILGRNGRWRRRPRTALALVVGTAALGAALGFWVYR